MKIFIKRSFIEKKYFFNFILKLFKNEFYSYFIIKKIFKRNMWDINCFDKEHKIEINLLGKNKVEVCILVKVEFNFIKKKLETVQKGKTLAIF